MDETRKDTFDPLLIFSRRTNYIRKTGVSRSCFFAGQYITSISQRRIVFFFFSLSTLQIQRRWRGRDYFFCSRANNHNMLLSGRTKQNPGSWRDGNGLDWTGVGRGENKAHTVGLQEESVFFFFFSSFFLYMYEHRWLPVFFVSPFCAWFFFSSFFCALFFSFRFKS